MTAPELAKGFTCQCGVEHKFPAYVYAHMRDVLDFTCPECGAEYSVIMAFASLKEKGVPNERSD